MTRLNDVELTDTEWVRFVETYLDRHSDSVADKTRMIHDDYIFDFVIDDGRPVNEISPVQALQQRFW